MIGKLMNILRMDVPKRLDHKTHCSFCSKHADQVEVLVTSDDASICEGCISVAADKAREFQAQAKPR